MDSNIVAYLKTRKLWDKLITFVLIVLTWALPQFGLDIPVEIMVMVTAFLMILSHWVVKGDVNFDLATLQESRERVVHIQNTVADLSDSISQSST